MTTRAARIAIGIGLGLLTTAALHGPAEAQVQICTNSGFSTTTGTVACDGSGSPVTASATVRNTARLTLEQIFGAPAAALTVAFGTVDAVCDATPVAGVTCAADAGGATWYGDLQFNVRLTGLGATTARLTGTRPALGSIPAGALRDGVAAGLPATNYPVAPTTLNLATGLGNGNNTVTRAFGLRVTPADAAAAWSGTTSYSVVIE